MWMLFCRSSFRILYREALCCDFYCLCWFCFNFISTLWLELCSVSFILFMIYVTKICNTLAKPSVKNWLLSTKTLMALTWNFQNFNFPHSAHIFVKYRCEYEPHKNWLSRIFIVSVHMQLTIKYILVSFQIFHTQSSHN
jgi:hypothetical protein